MTCFRVGDTCIGMTRHQVGRLFAPFQQVAFAAEKQAEGSGLGLSISNTLAILMGGSITVNSEPGSGSQFVLRLPLPAAAVPGCGHDTGRGEAPARVDRLAGVRVLVADDVSINRTIIETLLQAEGASVDSVADGAAAAEAVLAGGRDNYDVVLMDVEMPGMNGREATRQIRAAGCRVPVLGVTAHVAQEEHEASLAAGMDDQVMKPIMREQLVDLVRRHVVLAQAG